MIGFWNYTIVLTFLGLVFAIFGMTQADANHMVVAVACLAASGLCDAFDGRVAGTKIDRTRKEVLFGIQLDSLCDVICFGVFPAIICYSSGVGHYIGGIALSYYCICAVIRLAFFNTLETEKLDADSPSEKVYHGLPITSISIILPIIFFICMVAVPEKIHPIIYTFMLFIVGTLFILDFKLKKPSLKQLILIIVIVFVFVVASFVVLGMDLQWGINLSGSKS